MLVFINMIGKGLNMGMNLKNYPFVDFLEKYYCVFAFSLEIL